MKIRLVHLPTNQAWAFLFGDTIDRASIVPMSVGVSRQFLFGKRADAVEAAAACGLTVARSGLVS